RSVEDGADAGGRLRLLGFAALTASLRDRQPTRPPAYKVRAFSASRISRNNCTSSGGGTGSAVFASIAACCRRRRLTCLTIRKITKARITKLIATVTK